MSTQEAIICSTFKVIKKNTTMFFVYLRLFIQQYIPTTFAYHRCRKVNPQRLEDFTPTPVRPEREAFWWSMMAKTQNKNVLSVIPYSLIPNNI